MHAIVPVVNLTCQPVCVGDHCIHYIIGIQALQNDSADEYEAQAEHSTQSVSHKLDQSDGNVIYATPDVELLDHFANPGYEASDEIYHRIPDASPDHSASGQPISVLYRRHYHHFRLHAMFNCQSINVPIHFTVVLGLSLKLTS